MSLRCPADQTPLRTCSHKSLTLLTCGRCHGLWIPLEVLRILGIAGPVKPLTRNVSLRTSRRAKYRPCPACSGTTLLSKTFNGIELDLCPNCQGLWFDSGEFEQIIRRHVESKSLTRPAPDPAQVVHAVESNKPGALADLADLIENAVELAPDLAGEAAGALLEFMGDALGGIGP